MSGKSDTKHTPGPWHCDDVHPDDARDMANARAAIAKAEGEQTA